MKDQYYKNGKTKEMKKCVFSKKLDYYIFYNNNIIISLIIIPPLCAGIGYMLKIIFNKRFSLLPSIPMCHLGPLLKHSYIAFMLYKDF